MIYKAKFKYPLYRFLSDRGEGLKIMVSLNGLDLEVNTYKYNFPFLGLFGAGGPIQGSFINVIRQKNLNDEDKRSFEVLDWAHQHDSFKVRIMDNLLETQSNNLLNAIPKYDELNLSLNQIKELENNRLKLEGLLCEEDEDIVFIDNCFLSEEGPGEVGF